MPVIWSDLILGHNASTTHAIDIRHLPEWICIREDVGSQDGKVTFEVQYPHIDIVMAQDTV
jgi:hypothetical protein